MTNPLEISSVKSDNLFGEIIERTELKAAKIRATKIRIWKLFSSLNNLEIKSRSEHSRYHADATALIEYSKKNGPHNKGKKMSAEFCQKCRQSALKRGFNGNQYTKKK